jgi:hypothetical protein
LIFVSRFVFTTQNTYYGIILLLFYCLSAIRGHLSCNSLFIYSYKNIKRWIQPMPWNRIFTHIMNNEWQSLIYQNRYFKKGLRVNPYRILTQYLFILCKALHGRVCLFRYSNALAWKTKFQEDWLFFSMKYTCVSVWLRFQYIHLFQGYIYLFGLAQCGSAICELEIVGRQ